MRGDEICRINGDGKLEAGHDQAGIPFFAAQTLKNVCQAIDDAEHDDEQPEPEVDKSQSAKNEKSHPHQKDVYPKDFFICERLLPFRQVVDHLIDIALESARP